MSHTAVKSVNEQVNNLLVQVAGPNIMTQLVRKRADEKVKACVDLAARAYSGILALQERYNTLTPDMEEFDANEKSIKKYSSIRVKERKELKEATESLVAALGKVLNHNAKEGELVAAETFHKDFDDLAVLTDKYHKAYPTLVA